MLLVSCLARSSRKDCRENICCLVPNVVLDKGVVVDMIFVARQLVEKAREHDYLLLCYSLILRRPTIQFLGLPCGRY